MYNKHMKRTNMKRTNIYLTDKQHSQLVNIVKSDGIKLSEIIRRAIDEYLERIRRRSR